MLAEETVEKKTVCTKEFDWEPVMNAIIQVESAGNTKAVRGKSCGAMQITPILVAECNNILKGRNSKTRYTLRDRFNLEKSKEMFLLMQSKFNPSNNVEEDRMGAVVNALKDGKMVVEICEAYTITGSGSGHFIVLTGVTKDGYITIADCASRERTGKVYSVETIASYGRDLADGAFWIIGK